MTKINGNDKFTHRIIIGDSRDMRLVEPDTVALAVTSPPMWEPERKGSSADIGSSNTLDRYLAGVLMVWKEVFRVLKPGCRLCVHVPSIAMVKSGMIGTRRVPVYNGILNSCLIAGFEHDSVIVWNNEPKRNFVMDKNALTPREIDIFPSADFIMIFRKPGEKPVVTEAIAKKSRLVKKDASRLSLGMWTFPNPEADVAPYSFTPELPRRLIRLFSYAGEIVLDPFMGTGATSIAARDLGRLSIGFELDPAMEAVIKQKLSPDKPIKGVLFESQPRGDHRRNERKINDAKKKFYKNEPTEVETPIAPVVKEVIPEPVQVVTIVSLINVNHLRLSTGKDVKLLGVDIPGEFYSRNPGLYRWAFDYLRREVGDSPVQIKRAKSGGDAYSVYVSVSGKETLNEMLIRTGLALSDKNCDHDNRKKFDYLEKQARDNDMGMWALKKTDSPR